jgi:transcriptional regulator with XRE-family HTH domain
MTRKMNDDLLLQSIGRKIKLTREEKGVTQQDLAAMCNFEKSNLSRIEAGRSNCTLKTLNKIAKALGISITELLEGK